MNTVTNVNHVTVMKELRTVKGIKLLAIKGGSDVGFALSSKENNGVTELTNHRLWGVPQFQAIKAKYATTELFFDAVTDMMSV